MIAILKAAEIEAMINRQLVGRIGCHADGLTYVVPISYAYDGTYIYCHTSEGLKVQMMRKNPEVCVEIDDTTNLSEWKSVIAWGIFEELKDVEERRAALRLLQERILPMLTSETMHLAAQWPFISSTENIAGIVFRIRLLEKTGRFEKNDAHFFFAS